jgi:hypothetical protein
MPLARPLACGIIRLFGRGLEALPTLGCLRDGLSQWRNRLPRVSRERLARVYEGGFALSDREPQSQSSGPQGPEWLPTHYYLDESDPDVVVLRRQDGTFVAAFSSRGGTKEGILEAAKEDYPALLSGKGSAGEGPDPGGTRGGGG